jgi:hypothetical protein
MGKSLPLRKSVGFWKFRVAGISLIDESEISRSLFAGQLQVLAGNLWINRAKSYIVKSCSISSVEVLQKVARHRGILEVVGRCCDRK